jgi:putative endopeptidase
MRRFTSALILSIVCLALVGSRPPAAGEAAPASAHGVDTAAMDRSADPCVDFYQFACGGWMKNNPIPPDRGTWGRGSELDERNLAVLHHILDSAAPANPKRTLVEREIGDFYAACMDEPVVESKGVFPLKGVLARIEAIDSTKALAAEIARLHVEGYNLNIGGRGSYGMGFLFRFGSDQDFKDATTIIATVDQGGIGLPDRDYYLKDDAKSVETRDQYHKHLLAMFGLLGDDPDRAAQAADRVVALETALAKGSMDRVKRRTPENVYHKMKGKDLEALAPSFDWKSYFQAIGVKGDAALNVAVPDFFKGLEDLLKSQPLDTWKDYLRWQLARTTAPLLGQKFVTASFEFYDRTLGGAREIRPRWKRCATLTDTLLGEALGRPYVDRAFGADGKKRTLAMVDALEKALQKDIQDLPWMTEATKKQALVKLDAIKNKIGYPDKWRDYSGIRIARDDFAGNVARARAFEVARQIAKIGRPVDHGEWEMTPPTVNAYYDPQMNDINFPAGILQPPYYDNAADDAQNFGGIGSVIGHELTHGFDDQGRKFDPKGNLSDWWTAQDAAEFEKRATCLADEYSAFVAIDDVHLNGRLTLGENTADNGGLRIAYMAYLATMGGARPAASSEGGFTPEQRFFLGNAQAWCGNLSDEAARLRAQTDPHSLPKYRVNGVVSNMPEFQKAFSCAAGTPMVRENACRVW